MPISVSDAGRAWVRHHSGVTAPPPVWDRAPRPRGPTRVTSDHVFMEVMGRSCPNRAVVHARLAPTDHEAVAGDAFEHQVFAVEADRGADVRRGVLLDQRDDLSSGTSVVTVAPMPHQIDDVAVPQLPFLTPDQAVIHQPPQRSVRDPVEPLAFVTNLKLTGKNTRDRFASNSARGRRSRWLPRRRSPRPGGFPEEGVTHGSGRGYVIVVDAEPPQTYDANTCSKSCRSTS